MGKRILVSLAHPDDESFGSGPLIAKYVAEGAEVMLICATSGDVGTADEKFVKGFSSIAEMRLAELDCAAKVLGFKEVILFGYRDSGMMGSADNQHPDSLWQAPLEQVTAKVLEVMQRVRPQVVLTFDPYGGYGHPDHIKVHQATLAAFKAMQRDTPQKLYYLTIPRLMVRVGLMMLRLMRRDPRKFGRNQDMDMLAVYEHILPVHTRINVGPYLEIGAKAAACHASQMDAPSNNALVQALSRVFAATTYLTRVYPEPRPNMPMERDLFEGVTIS